MKYKKAELMREGTKILDDLNSGKVIDRPKLNLFLQKLEQLVQNTAFTYELRKYVYGHNDLNILKTRM
jgi:hypothetical protein